MYEWGLIDLKRLHDDVQYWEQHDDPKQPDYDTRDIEEVINKQPIVDAIPIEWLKQKANDLAYAYWYGAKNKVTLPMKDLPLVIETVVQYWRIENEI